MNNPTPPTTPKWLRRTSRLRTTGKIFLVLLIVFCSTQIRAKQANWTFLVYMDASEEDGHLSKWGLKNINDMAAVGSNEHINVLAQLHTHENVSWRYHIEKGIIKQCETVHIKGDCVQEVTDSMRWAVTNYPAKNYALILWDHGFGILDPKPAEKTSDGFLWAAEPDLYPEDCTSGMCPVKTYPMPFRGMLFHGPTQTYMTNQKMVATLKTIKDDVLNGNKLEIFGADVCKMAMLEVGYQIKDYANVLIGSQNCELADGWNYDGFLKAAATSPLSTHQLSTIIVDSYHYLESKAEQKVYTLSAIDLTSLDPLLENLETIIAACNACALHDPFNFKELVYAARHRCVTICHAPYYTDLHSFYEELENELETQTRMTIPTNKKEALLKALARGKQLVVNAVIANCAGENIPRARGISIYFPYQHVDSSYNKTMFAHETSWMTFLEETLGCK